MLKTIKNIYLYSAVYGLVVLFPQYFMETKVGIDFPPSITHPEFYYGFTGLALVWQLCFILISKDPIRYKPIMPITILEKASFGIPCLILFLQGRLHQLTLVFGCIDLLLMCLFIYSYLKTPNTAND